VGILFIIGLLAGPLHQLDLKTGSAVVEDTGHVVVVPGYHFEYAAVEVGLQLPIRVQLLDSKLRAEDLDDLQDYGRIIRRVKFGTLLEIGTLRNASDAQHLVLNHFFNRIDDDQPRTAAILRARLSGFKYTFFADQVFGPPIVAGLMALDAPSKFSMSASVLVDTDANARMLTNREHKMFGAGGLSLAYRIYRRGALTLTPYLSLAQTHLNASGTHLGLSTSVNRVWGWQVKAHAEVMAFTQHYIWAPFDLMYLIRKTRNDFETDGAIAPGWGGRLRVSLTNKRVKIGAQTSGAVNSPQQVHLAWMRFDQKPFSLFGVIYAARHNGQSSPVASTQMSGALSAQLKLSKSWMVESSIMHVHRVVDASYQHFLEAALMTNWRITFE
jgi:hypothetical protein